MLSDEQARKVALFFLFTFMEEGVAVQAAHQAVARLKSMTKGDHQNSIQESTTIRVLMKGLDQHRKSLLRQRSGRQPGRVWVLEPQVDIALWNEFRKTASDGEVVAVVLARILSFSEEDIAEALNLSIGTIRTRVSRGIRQLGQINRAKATAKAAGLEPENHDHS